MKLNRIRLRGLIKEELHKVLRESTAFGGSSIGQEELDSYNAYVDETMNPKFSIGFYEMPNQPPQLVLLENGDYANANEPILSRLVNMLNQHLGGVANFGPVGCEASSAGMMIVSNFRT